MSAHITDELKATAVAEFMAGENAADVAYRHHVSVTSVHKWVRAIHGSAAARAGAPERAHMAGSPDVYTGGWHNDRGITRPLFPERGTA